MRSYDLGLMLLPRSKREQYESVWLYEFEKSKLNGSNKASQLFRFVIMALHLRWTQSTSFRRISSLFIVGVLIFIYAEYMFLRNPILLFLIWLALKKLDFRATMLRRSLLVTVAYLMTISITHIYSLAIQSLRNSGYATEGAFEQAFLATGKVFVSLAILAMVASILFWLVEFLCYPNVFREGKILGMPIAFLAIGFWLYEGLHWLEVFEIAKVSDALIVQLSRIHQVTSNLVIPLLFTWLSVLAWNNLLRKKSERSLGSTVS